MTASTASTWKSCKLGDVIELKRGYDLPKSKRVDGKVPIISSSGESGLHNESKVEAPGVVTGRYGTLGEVFYVERDFWPLNTALYVKNFKNNNPRFVSYLLTQLDFTRQNVAGAVPGVNRNYLHMLNVQIPTVPEQEQIAELLSTYDNLIENNNRRIAILEEMAQSLYREWFVKFRFPGHQQAKFIDSPLGKIPEGWEVAKLGEVSSMKYGKMAKKEKLIDEGIPVYSGYRITGYYPELMFDESKVIVVARGVGGTGDVKMSPDICWLTNLSIAVLENQDKLTKTFLYFYLKFSRLRNLDSGSAQSQITIANLSLHRILLPLLNCIQK